jgi:hypothetical protein
VFALVLLALLQFAGVAQRSLSVRVDRWLAVQQMAGNVTFQHGNASRAANVGDRLQSAGDGIATGQNSTARLAVDTGVGFIDVSQNTRLQVLNLAVAPDNGRITHLQVSQGQARLQVRRFTHDGSDLEIRTPAGVSGVRGTEFGVNVQPDGKMGVATLDGDVETSAQGSIVMVPGGFQNLTIPGEPPQPAVPLRDNTDLEYEIARFVEGGVRRVRLIGRVDPVNSVFVGDEPQTTNRQGQFSFWLPLRNRIRLQVKVITPLGREQVHELEIPL